MQPHIRTGLTGVVTLSLLIAALAVAPQSARAAVQRVKFQSGNTYLIVEFLNDDLVHFELSALGPGPDTASPLFTTPQVSKTDYTGPSSFTASGQRGNTLDTADVTVVVNTSTLCFTVTDKSKSVALTTICPLNLSQDWKGLTIAPAGMQHVYGLGEQFVTSNAPNGDWTGQVRAPGDNFGNQMVGFGPGGGADGNAQIPVMYAVGANNANYALFLDQVYKQSWDFTGNPWNAQMWGDQIRGYVITGANLPALRQSYMDLTGHSPVPPKKMFGLWVSEYGYDDWGELEGKLSALRADTFPVDGFVLDLQWFGNVTAGSDNSNMGRVTWDTTHFPNAANKLATYKDNEGIGIITIEESYISKGLPEHADLQTRGYLVRAGCATCAPVYLTGNSWWGKGSMMDWTQDAAGDYWHDLKRQPLINDGVIGHWIDLGEPEMYDASDWTSGVLPGKHAHADYHNLYSLKWADSIARGYARNNVSRRPFMMARSGAAGIQRFGVSMWSGDIGSNLANLAAHTNAQMHMSMSGVDYFGSDIGGFHREALNGGDLNKTYTQWFASGMVFDVPGRPHTENLCNCKQTAPDLIGDKASNLANDRQRYELSPYLYSLAHRAYLAAEPVVPPLVYYYQNDPNVRRLADEKLLGRDLLVATVTTQDATQRDVYLPAGDWIDYHTNEWLHSSGQTFTGQPLLQGTIFRLPTYARAGAILPKMFVDDKTMNVLGKRTDGSTRNELIARVYASRTPSGFTLYEDDGETIAYQSGAVRTTSISQQLSADGTSETVTVAAASGTYDGAPSKRDNVIELVVEDAQATQVTLNGTKLPALAGQAAFDAASNGWFNPSQSLILAKSGSLNVGADKTYVFTIAPVAVRPFATFACKNGDTVAGQSVYVVGNIDRLGNWNPAQAVKLDPNGPYPTWTAVIKNLPPSTTVQWKCIKRAETGDIGHVDLWEPDPNNVLTTAASGDAGQTTGDFKGGAANVSEQFVCDNATTVLGQSVYVVGSIPALGTWMPAKAVQLAPTSYPRWTGTVANLPPNTSVEWKCIKRPENANSPVVWQPGANNVFTTPASGTGFASGSFQ